MKALTQEQTWAACDAGMGRPVTLKDAPRRTSFVYDREYGFFPVSFGMHQMALATLYAWHRGFDKAYDVISKSGWRDSSKAADALMEEFDGIAMMSGLVNVLESSTVRVMAFSPSKLNQEEKDFFGQITYVGE